MPTPTMQQYGAYIFFAASTHKQLPAPYRTNSNCYLIYTERQKRQQYSKRDGRMHVERPPHAEYHEWMKLVPRTYVLYYQVL